MATCWNVPFRPKAEASATIGDIPKRRAGQSDRGTARWRLRQGAPPSHSLVQCGQRAWSRGDPIPNRQRNVGAHHALHCNRMFERSVAEGVPPTLGQRGAAYAAALNVCFRSKADINAKDIGGVILTETVLAPAAPKYPAISARCGDAQTRVSCSSPMRGTTHNSPSNTMP